MEMERQAEEASKCPAGTRMMPEMERLETLQQLQ
jgi:hypothetical protein